MSPTTLRPTWRTTARAAAAVAALLPLVACQSAPPPVEAVAVAGVSEAFLPAPAVATSATETSLRVTWEYDGTERPFRLFLDSRDPVEVSGAAREHVFDGLRPGAQHFVQVQAVEGERFSFPVGLAAQTLRAPRTDTAVFVSAASEPAAPKTSGAAPAAPSTPDAALVLVPPALAAPKPSVPAPAPAKATTGLPTAPLPLPAAPLPAAPLLDQRSLALTVSPGGDVFPVGTQPDAGCVPEHFQGGEPVRITRPDGSVAGEGAVGECRRTALPGPLGVPALSVIRMVSTVPVAVGNELTWTLAVGDRSWPLDVDRLYRTGFKISLTKDGVSYPPDPSSSGGLVGTLLGGGFNLGCLRPGC